MNQGGRHDVVYCRGGAFILIDDDTYDNSTTEELKKKRRQDRSGNEPHVKVMARPGGTAEQLLRRFNREVHRAGIIRRLRELEFYEKPSKRKQRESKMRGQIVRKYSE